MQENTSLELLRIVESQADPAVGVTSSPSTTLNITIDIKDVSSTGRTLGQMVYVVLEEDGQKLLVIGQIVEIETQNRWHEDPAFKGVIKRHGRLPHLSGQADNRVATISVQACYSMNDENPTGYILGNSPSTGLDIQKMNNEVMHALVASHSNAITYIGKVYGTSVDLPFWFKHFGKTDEEHNESGAGDAFHIGVFGKTGSGKSVTAACMLLGYAKNKNNMSILVLDPQSQFYVDRDLLPGGGKLADMVTELGMSYEKHQLIKDICLPGDKYELFGELLLNNNFIKNAFRPISDEKQIDAKEEIVDYLLGRANNPGFDLNRVTDPKQLLKELLESFSKKETYTKPGRGGVEKEYEEYSKHLTNIYSSSTYQDRLFNRIENLLQRFDSPVEQKVIDKWVHTLEFFKTQKADGSRKLSVDDIVQKTVSQKGNFIVLDVGTENGSTENENLQALFINVIEKKVVEAGAELYTDGENRANCLIVMDEAHRFISHESSDPRIVELTKEIIDSVRTTRKYGIGYMFITQTIESLDKEILRQMRIFGFGYGLTSGPELKKISELVSNNAAVQLYKSFIDPSSNKKFPFMFFGPVSPLSFTGSPLFLEVYTSMEQIRAGMGMPNQTGAEVVQASVPDGT